MAHNTNLQRLAEEATLTEQRAKMVERQLKQRGIKDERVLDVMLRVPRHRFLPREIWSLAYCDHPLPIGEGQTISQPYIVGLMSEALRLTGNEKILEIGTGSGYQTAILSELGGQVFTIEGVSSLAQNAKRRLVELGYRNIKFYIGDGTIGRSEEAPFDRIIATGSVPLLPPSLCRQMAEKGIMVIPVGERALQKLLRVSFVGKSVIQQVLCQCSFVPLVGKEGWPKDTQDRLLDSPWG
ncbi:protein-L-isoaspartate(D-aspartate) O-methyltransferase [Candidatus Acetothermia bacterium]|nr:protein-L-isoaspartate(D-aspartate) O-methyltransferase [Candidatus Acetothermia bacterium]